MSTEQNKAVVRRFIERELNTMDLAVVDEILAPDYVNHMVPGGREGFKKVDAMMRSGAGFKMDITIEHLVAEGDYVVARIKFKVTNAGKEATSSELAEYRVVNGKIVDDWPPTNTAALLQQVGITLPGM